MTDSKGNVHLITREIAADEQGTLLATNNTDIIIRETNLHYKGSIRPSLYLMLSQIDQLILPLDYLESPHMGYTMNIPEGFAPFQAADTDLKLRVKILAQVAKILSKLHAIGISYGSIEHGRIFVSNSGKTDKAYLLYSANMDFNIYLNEDDEEIDTTMDTFAFGSFASDILSGYSIDLQLKRLLTRSQDVPEERPKMIELYRAFLQQIDMLIKCKQCGLDMHYEDNFCPSCHTSPPSMIKATIYDIIDKTSFVKYLKIMEFNSSSQDFTNFHTDNLLMDDPIKPAINCGLDTSSSRNLNYVFTNLMDKEIVVNDVVTAHGDSCAIALPCDLIRISFDLSSKIKRRIDMVIV